MCFDGLVKLLETSTLARWLVIVAYEIESKSTGKVKGFFDGMEPGTFEKIVLLGIPLMVDCKYVWYLSIVSRTVDTTEGNKYRMLDVLCYEFEFVKILVIGKGWFDFKNEVNMIRVTD